MASQEHQTREAAERHYADIGILRGAVEREGDKLARRNQRGIAGYVSLEADELDALRRVVDSLVAFYGLET